MMEDTASCRTMKHRWKCSYPHCFLNLPGGSGEKAGERITTGFYTTMAVVIYLLAAIKFAAILFEWTDEQWVNMAFYSDIVLTLAFLFADVFATAEATWRFYRGATWPWVKDYFTGFRISIEIVTLLLYIAYVPLLMSTHSGWVLFGMVLQMPLCAVALFNVDARLRHTRCRKTINLTQNTMSIVTGMHKEHFE